MKNLIYALLAILPAVSFAAPARVLVAPGDIGAADLFEASGLLIPAGASRVPGVLIDSRFDASMIIDAQAVAYDAKSRIEGRALETCRHQGDGREGGRRAFINKIADDKFTAVVSPEAAAGEDQALPPTFEVRVVSNNPRSFTWEEAAAPGAAKRFKLVIDHSKSGSPGTLTFTDASRKERTWPVFCPRLSGPAAK